jgi:hypothetical protein
LNPKKGQKLLNLVASTQPDLDKFFTLYKKKFRIFQKILKRISLSSKSECSPELELEKHIHAKFQLKFQEFLRKFQNFLILKEVPNRAFQKASFAKI